jgi:AraC-like DNA-binding protein
VIIYRLLQFYNQNEQIRCDTCFLGEAWLDSDQYHDFFKGTSRFNEPVNRMEFDVSLLKGSTSVCNPFLSPYLEGQVMRELQLIHAQKNSGPAQLYHRVREHISTVAREEGFENLNVDAVCRQLNMSRWTLRRKLGEEGISYKTLIAELRQKEAAKQLSDMSLMIGDISDRLGFSSQGAFSRFFLLHFGMTPSEYRFAAGDWQAQ